MKNGETNINRGGEEMAIGFDSGHLTFAIRDKGLTRREFRDLFITKCAALGVSAPSDAALSTWFLGKHEPKASYVRVMSLVLNKPMEFFVGGEAV